MSSSTNPHQAPIGSGFGATTTAEEVIRGVDLRGKTTVVTGGYSGIGLETVRAFHGAGAKVVVPARDHDKASRALADLPGVEIAEMDLLNPQSIATFARRFVASGQPLHLLVNNAGVMACPKALDSRGYEVQFATNHLGHFQLTNALWPALVKAQGARIVNVSSLGHRFSPVIFEDINFEHRDYDRWLAYGQSKTANILFAVELDQRGQRDGIRAFALHPGGIIETDLKRYLTDEDIRAFGILDENGAPVRNPSMQLKTIPQGASTQVWCATSSRLDSLGGVYCENCNIAAINAELNTSTSLEGRLGQSGVMPYAIDPLAAGRLWAISEAMIGPPR